MELARYCRERRWATVFGYVLFAGTMATGYFYNLTFVQLGLVDLGARLVGLDQGRLAGALALFALLTSGAALALGVGLGRRGWSRDDHD